MSYSAYERNSAGSSCKLLVESLQRAKTQGGTFSTSSTPSLSDVETFLTLGSGEIAGMLSASGYSQAQTDADVLAVLERWNAFAACELIEASDPSAGGGFPGNEPVSRLQFFGTWRRQARDFLKSNALNEMGAGRTHGLSTGGVSISDKETIETDSDFESYIFSKGRFIDPGVRDRLEEGERLI